MVVRHFFLGKYINRNYKWKLKEYTLIIAITSNNIIQLYELLYNLLIYR